MLRTAIVATAIGVLGVAGHTAASGELPGSTHLMIVAGVAWALSVPAAKRRRSIGWAIGYLVGAQVLLHLAMGAVPGVVGGHGAHGLVPDARMLTFHLGAAAVAAVVLVNLDRIVGRLTAWGRRLLGVGPGVPTVARFHRVAWFPPQHLLPLTVTGSVSSRAPPSSF